MCLSLSGMVQVPALAAEVWREEEVTTALDIPRLDLTTEPNMARNSSERDSEPKTKTKR